MINKNIKIIFAAIFVLISWEKYAQENYIVRDILFTGNTSLSSEILLEQIQHFPRSWFSDVILFEDPFLFSKDIFEKDKESIIRLYQREGFINTKIESVYFERDDENKTVTTMAVELGKPVNQQAVKNTIIKHFADLFEFKIVASKRKAV